VIGPTTVTAPASRIDLGLAEHVDCLFLSDPDWTEHHLAYLWKASH
jgi:alpha-galactosidase